MFGRLVALLVLGFGIAGSAFAQSGLVCAIDNDFTGVVNGQQGSYTVIVTPGAAATLQANCSPGVNSYNWNPGSIQTPSIQVIAPSTPGSSAQYTLTGCNASSFTCAAPVTLTVQVASATAPDCTLSAVPNPATSGQAVTFTASCSTSNPPPTSIIYRDFSQTTQVSQTLTFTDVAPAVSTPTEYHVFYQPVGSGGATGVQRVLRVLINPVGLPTPANCTLNANPNPIVLGNTTVLTATCSAGGAATSYTFLDSNQNVIRTASSNTLVVTPPNIGGNVYYVRASNANGQGPLVSTQINVLPMPPANCTLTASPNPIPIGASTVLTGSCPTGGPAISYAFTYPDGTVFSGPSPTLVVTPPAVGSFVFSFVAANAGGPSTPVTTTVIVQAATCTITASQPNPVPRNTQVTLSAACNNQPNQFSWSTASGPISGANTSTLTVTPAATTAYTVTASNGQSTVPIIATGQYTIVVSSASAIAAVPGGPLTGIPGRPLSRNLQVRVVDAAGNPVAQELVNWSVVNPGSSPGTFAANPSAPTDTQGIATNTFTMGAGTGGRTLRACLAALPAVCADFQVLPGASAIANIVGTTITGTPGRPLSRELQVRVADLNGAPVAGEPVTWSVVNPGSSPGTFAANPSPPTDAQGITRNTFVMGTDPGGRTLRACLASLPTICTDFQVVPGANGLVAIAGTPLVGAPGRPLSRDLQVRATDAQGNPVPQEIVNWTVVNPGPNTGTFASNPSAPTDAQGITRNTFIMGTDPGGRTLRACLASQPSVCVDFVVRSLNAALERPAAKIMSPMAELAVATPLAQLSNIRFRLDQLRLRRNPSVIEALRVSVAGRSLPPFSAFALAPLDKNGKPVPQKGGGAAADDPFERLGFFVNGDVEIGKQSATGVQNGYDLHTKGLTAGADYRLPSDNVVGVAAGFMSANTDLAEAGGSQGARGYSLSAYGSFIPATGTYIDVIAHLGNNKYDTRRRELTDAGAPLDYNSNTRGNQVAFAFSVGADFNRGPLIINPYLRLDYINAKINSFSESGDDGAIRVGDLDLKTTVATLGGQLSYAISTSWGVLMPNARLELQRRIQGDGRNVNAQLVADGTINALVPLEAVDRNYGTFAVGVSTVLPRGVNGFLNYERLFGRDGYNNSKVTAGVRFEF